MYFNLKTTKVNYLIGLWLIQNAQRLITFWWQCHVWYKAFKYRWDKQSLYFFKNITIFIKLVGSIYTVSGKAKIKYRIFGIRCTEQKSLNSENFFRSLRFWFGMWCWMLWYFLFPGQFRWGKNYTGFIYPSHTFWYHEHQMLIRFVPRSLVFLLDEHFHNMELYYMERSY